MFIQDEDLEVDVVMVTKNNIGVKNRTQGQIKEANC